MADTYHLTWDSDNERWSVKREGASRASDSFDRHGAALARGKELASNSGGSLVLHDESGRITGSLSGDDLRPGFVKAVAEKVKGIVG